MTARGERRSIQSMLGNILLTIAALGGLICIVLVVLSFAFNITLIMFKTGSMSPTIPQGSLAVVQQIPASKITVGDVVTVDRGGALPVTHRVTSIEGGGSGARVITMRGDANTAEDAAPYTVEKVRLVLFSVPGLAYAVAAMSSPIALGIVSFLAAALVTWAFWPSDPTRVQPPGRHRRRGSLPPMQHALLDGKGS
jgi:signal peptidase